MSLWDDLMCKLTKISDDFSKNLHDEFNLGLAAVHKFEKEILCARDASQLHCIREHEGTMSVRGGAVGAPRAKPVNGQYREAQVTPPAVDEHAERAATDKEPPGHTACAEAGETGEGRASSARAPAGKRSKEEMGGGGTPEQDKRHKRNASVRAQGIISKQVNVNLSAKLRRPLEAESGGGEAARGGRGAGRADGDKENRTDNVPLVRVKQEKVSLPEAAAEVAVPEPAPAPAAPAAPAAATATAAAPDCPADVAIKTEVDKEAMPPPPAPLTKTRRARDKKKAEAGEGSAGEEEGGRRSSRRKQTDTAPPPPTETRRARDKKKAEAGEGSAGEEEGGRRSSRRKQTDTAPPPPPTERRTRASSRAAQEEEAPPPEPRPKRTRARKQQQEAASEADSDKSQGSAIDTDGSTSVTSRASAEEAEEAQEAPPPPEPRPKRTRARKQQQEAAPATLVDADKPQETPVELNEKPRPKRTRRGRRASKVQSPVKQEPPSPPPAAPAKRLKPSSSLEEASRVGQRDGTDSSVLEVQEIQNKPIDLEETQILSRASEPALAPAPASAPAAAADRSSTESIPAARNMNDTVVLEAANAVERGTVVLGKAPAMDETIVINKAAGSDQMTNDDSLLTDDLSEEIEDTPPRSMIPIKQPTSAVKVRVQHYEELASGSRLTRTKTRAKQSAVEENVSPSEHGAQKGCGGAGGSAGKLPTSAWKNNQILSSASKPRTNIVASVKSFLPSSACKAAAAVAGGSGAAAAAAEAAERREKEDARRKKEALLEAKREEGRRRREQKMAAAAATREELARERAAQQEATARGRQEKQAHAHAGKLEKLKEVEKKKLAMERKAAETEARRRNEEAARQARLEEEQRRAEAARRKQQEEAERIKKEELRVEREMQLARQEYIEKEKERERQKLLLLQKQRMMATDKMHTPMKLGGTPCKPMAPVHLEDGFQYLNSDEDDDKPKRAPPDWSRSKARWDRLVIQDKIPSAHVDRLFSVQRHTPDLREVFPAIDRRRLKRTSSAVWRTPPRLPHLPE